MKRALADNDNSVDDGPPFKHGRATGACAKAAGKAALDLHSSRSQVDIQRLSEIAINAELIQSLKDRNQNANSAKQALEITRQNKIDLAAPVAVMARETALASLRGASIDVDVLVVDREGKILARTP
ncbi:MAG: hypothetical protein MnENMB40S_23720 [Rhizobiaceae bacterium MnEN-MB40S]|nr:MAG: hypothetical protein MnENMB40S_23720 [Rhizobiaceae bacterium MnEN-MB40S]